MNLEKQTKMGALKYRLPNIAEGYDYLTLVDQVASAEDVFRIKGKIIHKMGDLLDYKALGYADYNEVLNDKENMRVPLSEISKEIFDDIVELIAKKD